MYLILIICSIVNLNLATNVVYRNESLRRVSNPRGWPQNETYPWTSIAFLHIDTDHLLYDYDYECTGIIVTDRLIISAASCFHGTQFGINFYESW